MAQRIVSLCETELISDITAADTTVTVKSPAFPFPNIGTSPDFFAATLESPAGFELVRVDTITPNGPDFDLTVQRGFEGTTPTAFSTGDKLKIGVTAGFMKGLVSDDTTAVSVGNISVTHLKLLRTDGNTHFEITMVDRVTKAGVILSIPTMAGEKVLLAGKELVSETQQPDELPVGSIVMYSGIASAWADSRWKLCDGVSWGPNPQDKTVDLRNKFVIAANSVKEDDGNHPYTSKLGGKHTHTPTVGSKSINVYSGYKTLTAAHLPPHNHYFDPKNPVTPTGATSSFKVFWTNQGLASETLTSRRRKQGLYGMNPVIAATDEHTYARRWVVMSDPLSANLIHNLHTNYFTIPNGVNTEGYYEELEAWADATTKGFSEGSNGHRHEYTLSVPNHNTNDLKEGGDSTAHDHSIEIFPDFYEVAYYQKVRA